MRYNYNLDLIHKLKETMKKDMLINLSDVSHCVDVTKKCSGKKKRKFFPSVTFTNRHTHAHTHGTHQLNQMNYFC